MCAFFGLRGLFQAFHAEESGALSLIVGGFTLWMLIECLRKDPERAYWWWIIIVLPGIGPLAYFFIRWLPEGRIRLPRWVRGLTRGSELRRLHSAARQIGNPYQYVQLGEALRDTGQFDRASAAYQRALEKEPANLAALWGAALIDVRRKDYESARPRLEQILKIDPQYKFGDVSLAYARVLINLDRRDDALAHLEKHVKRWRHPEGLYLLAVLYSQNGKAPEACDQLEAMIAEIESSPAPIARKQGQWRRRGRQLLRKLS